MAEFIIYLTLEESYERIHKQFSEKEASKKISAVDSKVSVYVIPTNEELMIAKETKRIVEM